VLKQFGSLVPAREFVTFDPGTFHLDRVSASMRSSFRNGRERAW